MEKLANAIQKLKEQFIKTAEPTALVKAFRRGEFGQGEKAIAVVKKLVKKLTTKNLPQKPRQLKPLGQGAEGVADLVTHPKSGIAVQKVYDKKSPYYSKHIIDAKLNILNNIKSENLTKFYGTHSKTKNVHYTEYVPNKTSLQNYVQAGKDFKSKILPKLNKEVSRLGEKALIDVNINHNVHIDKKGTPKIIDFLTQDSVNKFLDTKYLRRKKRIDNWIQNVNNKSSKKLKEQELKSLLGVGSTFRKLSPDIQEKAVSRATRKIDKIGIDINNVQNLLVKDAPLRKSNLIKKDAFKTQ